MKIGKHAWVNGCIRYRWLEPKRRFVDKVENWKVAAEEDEEDRRGDKGN
jgi:hypothetical protein